MTLENLQCPACGSRELKEIDVDTFKCPHCGMSFMLSGRDEHVIDYKKRIKELEAETEQLRQQLNAKIVQTKMAYDDAEKERKTILPRAFAKMLKEDGFLIYAVGILFLMLIILSLQEPLSEFQHTRRVKALEKSVSEIQQDIDEGRYGEALVKTESIRGDNYNTEDTKRWESTRKALIKQIEEEKAKANNYTIIAMPERSARYVGEPYESVVSKLTSAGFTNIVTKEADQKSGLFHSAKDVNEISVRGTMSFEKGEEFPSNAEIIIYYYPE